MNNKHFTNKERRRIAEFLEQHLSKAEIARRLGRSKSSVSDEIYRNRTDDGVYLACEEEEKVRARACRPRGAYKKDNGSLLAAIEDDLVKKWSPKIIAEKLGYRTPAEVMHTARVRPQI